MTSNRKLLSGKVGHTISSSLWLAQEPCPEALKALAWCWPAPGALPTLATVCRASETMKVACHTGKVYFSKNSCPQYPRDKGLLHFGLASKMFFLRNGFFESIFVQAIFLDGSCICEDPWASQEQGPSLR